jgi:hypothetical protein
MIFIRLATVALFAIGWLVAVASWFYAVFHLAIWLFRRDDSHRSKAIRGGAVFLAGWAFAFASGFIGALLGSWQQISDGKLQ